MPKYRLNKSNGFTLIEVLLAGVILIISVSAMTLIYRTATIASTKASDTVRLHGNTNLIMLQIQNQIRNANATEPLSGVGNICDINFRWNSHLEKKSGAPNRFSADTGEWQAQPERFYLWQVNVYIEYGDSVKELQFKEVSWQG